MATSAYVRLAGHHDNPARFRQRVEATLIRQPDGALEIACAIRGPNLDLRVPTPHAPAPADALWRTTCCEIFLGPAGQSGYREFNFSPSGQWRAYDFTDTRQRSPVQPEVMASMLDFRRSEDLLHLDAHLPRASLPPGETLRIAVAVILEAEGGHHGYWALAHPPGKPDFHHHAGFVLTLGPAGFRPALWP